MDVTVNSIGLAIAERLGQEGAHVVISSRKQANVVSALQRLKQQGLSVEGMVCHVGRKEDREHLLRKVCLICCCSLDGLTRRQFNHGLVWNYIGKIGLE